MNINPRLLIAIILIATTASAAEPKTELRILIDDSVNWYDFLPHQNAEPMKPLVALRWGNSTRGTNGATVLWLAKGRPEAVAAIYPWKGSLIHDFDSLSRGTFIAKRDDRIVWNPNSPGVQFRPIDDAPTPASKPNARLRQMKLLTKQFRVKLLGFTSDNSQREELRMLTTPLYRYAIDEPEKVQDGAIFAYVTSTDPEALLVIESSGEANVFRWQYAFARRTSGGLEGRFRNQVVWTVDKYPQKDNPLLNFVQFSHPLPEALETIGSGAAP